MMTRRVIVTTPVPTLEEFGKRLGISKVRQKAILRLIAVDGSVKHSEESRSMFGLKKFGKSAAKRI